MIDAVTTVLVTFLGGGGVLVTWLNLRAAKQKRVSSPAAEAEALTAAVESSGIADRWREYADGIERRLGDRIQHLEASLTATRRSHDRAIAYIDVLRSHIHQELPPPPPPWPEGIE